ncbi:ABC transporter substrate binding protein [Paraglaciecola sp. L3A3]|uniref:ABC transporter substrate binding protein n=1 Tax=Paraglaciecola sp. L3A3 TaxID=2686358 RepID=UPI00131E14A9|nr:ABC transporter substrate binding protein [Paraglaciecola sp. L3A3]
MKKEFLRTINYFILCLSFFCSSSLFANQAVLVIHSYHQEHLWTGFMKLGIDQVLTSEDNVMVYHEYLDAKRYPHTTYQKTFFNYLQKKYSNTPLDALMVSDDYALTLLSQQQALFIAEVPVVYLGINKISNELLNKKNYTGVFENRDLATTVFDIKALTKNDALIVISDSSMPGKANLAKVMAVKNDPRAPKQLYIINDIVSTNITNRMEDFAKNIPILKIGQLISPESSHSLASWNNGTKILTSALPNPVFTIASTTLKYGSVGSHELNGKQHGIQAAHLVKRILQGEEVNNIKAITNANSTWTFNWQALKKHGMQEANPPDGSVILHRDVSFYQQNKILVWVIAATFLIALLIITLLTVIIINGRDKRKLLAENELRYKDLAHSGASIFWETDSLFVISYISGNTAVLWNKAPEQLIGMPFTELMQNNNIEFPLLELKQAFSSQQPLEHILFKCKVAENKAKVFMLNGKSIADAHGFKGYRGICNDVSKEQDLSEKLTYQATYDSLTGLINRETFNLQLVNYIAQSNHLESSSYLCFLDLDRFKLVNDTAGHLVGDAMLEQVAQKLKSCLDKDDILGRVGGDEFGLLMVDKSHEDALAICEKIITVVNQFKFNWHKRYFSVGVSIGMVSIIEHFSATDLLSKADIACYKAKELGKNRVFSTKADSDELHQDEQQMAYIANVSQAIEQEQFYLVKQLICATDADKKHQHYEVLIRYKDELGNIISPASFIPAAEKFGVITLIDKWVVTKVFNCFEQYFSKVNCISINLSGLSLSDESFIEYITLLLAQGNVDPERICFEITETAAISNIDGAISFMLKMKTLGIRFALDDFGSGTSSFGYLKSLPVDYLKIDGSLVKNILTEPVDKAIIASIHDIAQMLGMQTIAEFVENNEIRQALDEIGIDYVQGYGIGKPEPC